jgi:hypothetical protein
MADLLKEFLNFSLVKTRQFLFAFDNHGPFQKVLVRQHELYGLFFRRWFLLHVPFAIERRARIQKLLYRSIADDLSQLFLGQRLLTVLPFFPNWLFWLARNFLPCGTWFRSPYR